MASDVRYILGERGWVVATWRAHPFLVCAALVIALATGCSEDPAFPETIDVPFSVFGTLSPQADTQSVRVFAVEPALTPEPALDARLTSTDLETGEVVVWHDSLATFSDGSRGHVFWAPLRVRYGSSYRLDIVRSDGASSTIDVQVPPLVGVPDTRPSDGEPWRMETSLPAGRYRLVDVRLRHRAWGAACEHVPAEVVLQHDEEAEAARLRRDGVGEISIERMGPEGPGLIDINLIGVFRKGRDRLVFLNQIGAVLPGNKPTVVFVGAELELLIGSVAWAPPGGSFDADALVQPGTFSNVENGFGFVGAGYLLSVDVKPSVEGQVLAGYIEVPDECF